jgi:hypothetical protein
MEKAVRIALLLAVLLIAGYLCMTGSRWRLTCGYGHEQNFQPDEFTSLGIIGTIRITCADGSL